MANIHQTESVTYGVNNDRPSSALGRPGREQVSNASISINSRSNRQRIPPVLMNALRGMVENQIMNAQGGSMKRSRFGNMMRSGLHSMKNKIKNKRDCQICESQIAKASESRYEVYMCNCEHKFNFCESCLHHYVIYKVRNFEQVNCPRQGCPAVLDTSTNFFKDLPVDIQKNYRKIRQFQQVSKDPDTKLCPRQNCQGIIRTKVDGVMECDQCRRQFCGKCLLAVHEGDCDRHEVIFFEENLKYRQCKKCKMIVEKNQGCNHITCRCKYQFCYVCGAPWTTAHYGNHDQNGNLQQVPVFGERAPQGDADCECGCHCLDECCGETCANIILFPLRLILFLLLCCFLLIVWFSRDLFVIISLLFVSVIAGITGFTVEILSQLDGILCLLGVLFLPIVMIVGIGRAINEIFCDTVGALCQDFCQMFTGGMQALGMI